MHILITGASSGIGEALAKELADSNNSLTLVARNEAKLKALANALNCKVTILCYDLSIPNNCNKMIEEAEKKFGQIDMLINNAGIQIIGRTDKINIDEGEKLMRLNVQSPLRLISLLLPKMMKRNNGVIVNISSVAAFNSLPYMFYYTASKAALGNASESLASELKDSNIHVLTVYPGPISTAMEDKAKETYQASPLIDMMPSGSPEELAQKIHKAIRQKKERIIFPENYTLVRYLSPLVNWLSGFISPKPKE